MLHVAGTQCHNRRANRRRGEKKENVSKRSMNIKPLPCQFSYTCTSIIFFYFFFRSPSYFIWRSNACTTNMPSNSVVVFIFHALLLIVIIFLRFYAHDIPADKSFGYFAHMAGHMGADRAVRRRRHLQSHTHHVCWWFNCVVLDWQKHRWHYQLNDTIKACE